MYKRQALFFVLLFVAALTSAISLLEVVAAYFIDEMKWSRTKAAWVMGFCIFLLGIPSVLGVAGKLPTLAGRDFLDSADFLASNILLPLGGLFIALFVGWFWTEGAKQEVTNDGTVPFGIYTLWLWACLLYTSHPSLSLNLPLRIPEGSLAPRGRAWND